MAEKLRLSFICSLVYVSTLDGRVHALDAASQGKKQWTLNFNDEPLLSSNIHRKEVSLLFVFVYRLEENYC